MRIPFWKMHGAGNDFILVDDRNMTFPSTDRAWLQATASRRIGVGCEGIILIQPSQLTDFRMRFYNPDGGEVEMCGNGARCVARLAHEIGAAPEKMTFDTVAGPIRAEVRGEQVLLGMTPPKDWVLGETLDLDGRAVPFAAVDSGVPHVVVTVEDVDQTDVHAMGSAIRYHEQFEPAGTNANFVQVTGPHSLRIRTYERGVEGETLACGTGIVASALLSARAGKVSAPVDVTAASGHVIEVDFTLTDEGAENVTMLGPAEHVFEGVLTYQA
jgi:diaminopimelate epimerase